MGERVIKFTVPLIPISKKNHPQIIMNKKTKKPILLPSPEYRKYEKEALPYIPNDTTIDYPVNVKCLFYMPTRRRVDLTNLLEAIDDVMVKGKLLEDDNFKIIESHDGSRVLYDKENPHTEIVIERSRNEV